ncbi:hypothetical protein [Pseudomonas aeruginosa]|uniref:hypothetical protein n=1 Tax=Pseudomonas aeruginosa TaxID=287 RepID=UPI003D2AFC38|nr:hypothetical protein [Pseudomonas aeruginosa]
MAIHEHWTRHLPAGNERTSELSKAIEGDNEHLSNLLDRVDTVLEQRLQRIREAGVNESSGYSIDQIEHAKALVGRELVQGSLRAANVLHQEARFMMTSTSEVTERLVDAIAEKTLELIKLLKELEGTCASLQLVAKTPRS